MALRTQPTATQDAMAGRWPSRYGAGDEAGALNEITPGKVLEAIRLVRQGRVYDLAHVLHQDIPAFPGRTFRQYLTTNYHHINRRRSDAGPAGLGRTSVNWIVEQVTATQQMGTHMDGLNHLQVGDRTYNGFRLADIVEDHGTNRRGIETLPQVVTRGLDNLYVVDSSFFVSSTAVTLSATSLGLVVPVLKDAGQVHSEVGQTALAAASIADFAAIVLLSLFFSASGRSTGARVVVLGAFAGLVAVTGIVVSGAARSMRLGQVLVRLQDTTAEIRVRFAVLLPVAFTVLAERFGLESILSAFLAGAIVGLVDRDSTSHPNFRTKLDAIGYGFLVPVFFVSSGIRLDLTGLLHNPSALAGSRCSCSRCWPCAACPRCSACAPTAPGRPWPSGCCRRPRCRSS